MRTGLTQLAVFEHRTDDDLLDQKRLDPILNSFLPKVLYFIN